VPPFFARLFKNLPCNKQSIAMSLFLAVSVTAWAQDAMPVLKDVPGGTLAPWGVAAAGTWIGTRLIGLVDRATKVVETLSEHWKDGKLETPVIRVRLEHSEIKDEPTPKSST
jgi:hypothetical protein